LSRALDVMRISVVDKDELPTTAMATERFV
jgi:hypothetical protein